MFNPTLPILYICRWMYVLRFYVSLFRAYAHRRTYFTMNKMEPGWMKYIAKHMLSRTNPISIILSITKGQGQELVKDYNIYWFSFQYHKSVLLVSLNLNLSLRSKVSVLYEQKCHMKFQSLLVILKTEDSRFCVHEYNTRGIKAWGLRHRWRVCRKRSCHQQSSCSRCRIAWTARQGCSGNWTPLLQ